MLRVLRRGPADDRGGVDDLAADAALINDVIIGVDPSHSVGQVTEAICRHLDVAAADIGLTSRRTGLVMPAIATFADVDIVSGDEVVLGPAGLAGGRHPLPNRAITVDLIAGPDSGRSRLLQAGRFAIGRSADADVVVDDPSVSRHHADVVVDTELSVVLHPVPGAANGVTVDDEDITSPRRIRAEDVVGLGATRLAFRPFERRAHEHHDRLGQIDFQRTPYRPIVVAERDAEPVGPLPTRAEPRRFQLLAVLAPVAAGLAMYAFTRQVQFLALTLISPVVMIATAIDERRSGRRTFRHELNAFRDGLDDHRARFEELRRLERVERLRAAPDVADLTRRAEHRTLDLWARGRDAPDFLALRIGLGSDTVRFAIDLDRGGDDDLRDEAREAIAGVEVLDHVPVTVDLRADVVFGVHGERSLVDGIVSSLAVQAATLHSPEDLTIAAAVAPERGLDWLKWLPHLRSVASPLPGGHLATTRAEADALVQRLLEVVAFRATDGSDRAGTRTWPRVLVFLDGELGADPAEVARLLDGAPSAGVSVVWLASSAAGVTRQATRTLALDRGEGGAMDGRLWSTDPVVADRRLEVEHLRRRLADRAARALAPVRDASTASLATSIPRTAPLLDVLRVGRPTAARVGERWLRNDGYGLRFPIGVGAQGDVELDLVEDGPHALVGGTSGSGKSELLQSMVAALAVRHPSTRLNFLFVDYKGGASSQVFERLPHTVGYVTNLSAELSRRALTSLRAELHRRMAVMEGRAKDLADMIEIDPEVAPPSLVIVVDEFATLVKEVPEFVAGVIDIAQRGRSLGIHLVLATQRPSGSVDENILANTNLRISLRMLDRSESTAILDSPDAADIPVPLRGRGLVRCGPGQLVEFQCAFGGAPLSADEEGAPVLVDAFERPDDTPSAGATATGRPATADDGPATQLAAVIDAVVAADAALGLPPARRPWREVLPTVVPFDEVLATDRRGSSSDPVRAAFEQPGRFVVVGLLDDPDHQDQRPAVIDLEDSGGLLVFGCGGSGKTTLLRTVAASISATASADDAAVIVFDFASRGLSGLAALPDVVDVATGDDIEAVTRHLAVLDAELERRRRQFATAGAEHLTAYRREHHDAPPRIVVLVDGFGALVSSLLEPTGGVVGAAAIEEWGERVLRLIVEGRQVGIHTIVTADRRNAVPARIHAAVGSRLILRHADETGYAEHGIGGDRARGLDLPPGRGLLRSNELVQVATVGCDPSARAQGEAVAELARGLAARGRLPTDVLASAPLPDRIELSTLSSDARRRTRPGRGCDDASTDVARRPVIGVADVLGDAVAVDLTWSDAVVCGPPRSGRSNALAALAATLDADHEVHVVAPGSSPLRRLGLERAEFGRPAELLPFLDRLANLVAMGAVDRAPRVLLLDDADALDDPALAGVWERLAGLDELRVVASIENRAMAGYTASPIVNRVRRARRLLVLQPDDPGEFLQTTGVKLPLRPGVRLPAGRGVLLVDRIPTTVQVGAVAGLDEAGLLEARCGALGDRLSEVTP